MVSTISRSISGSSSYDLFYGHRKNIFLVFYVISVIAIGFAIIFFLFKGLNFSGDLLIYAGIILLIMGAVGGAYLAVLLELPSISHKFDMIKNDIALKKIRSPEVFGKRLTELICNYFSFTFFTIDYSFIKIIETDYIFSDPEIKGRFGPAQYDIMLKKTQETEDIILFGRKKENNKNYYLYLIPIWFGSEWLGFIGVYSPKKLRKIFVAFLSNFENDFIDDQLVHVTNYRKGV